MTFLIRTVDTGYWIVGPRSLDEAFRRSAADHSFRWSEHLFLSGRQVGRRAACRLPSRTGASKNYSNRSALARGLEEIAEVSRR